MRFIFVDPQVAKTMFAVRRSGDTLAGGTACEGLGRLYADLFRRTLWVRRFPGAAKAIVLLQPSQFDTSFKTSKPGFLKIGNQLPLWLMLGDEMVYSGPARDVRHNP
jgi:hypothetical protein